MNITFASPKSWKAQLRDIDRTHLELAHGLQFGDQDLDRSG